MGRWGRIDRWLNETPSQFSDLRVRTLGWIVLAEISLSAGRCDHECQIATPRPNPEFRCNGVRAERLLHQRAQFGLVWVADALAGDIAVREIPEQVGGGWLPDPVLEHERASVGRQPTSSE